MTNPLLGIKCFVLCVVIGVILYLAFLYARNYRIMFGEFRFLPSSTETWLFIAFFADIIIALLCLAWSAVSWIAS